MSSGEPHRFFGTIDAFLEGGGQVILDIGCLLPGGPVVNAGQAVYHLAHATDDMLHGETLEAAAQAVEVLWNAVNAVPVIHHALHPVHVAELVWDAGASVNRWAGSRLGHIPTALEGLSRILPWALGRAPEPVTVVATSPAPAAA